MDWHFEEKVDLSHPRGAQNWPDLMMVQGDHEAHEWRVVVCDNRQPVDMTGYVVVAYFERIDGMTVPVNGSVAGNVAAVTLPQSVYAVGGQVLGLMRASKDGQIVTLAAGRWNVRRGPGDEIVDPGHVVPSLEELLARIEEMEAATDAANTAATAANNAAATVDAKVESTVAPVIEDVSALKNAINNRIPQAVVNDTVSGSYSPGITNYEKDCDPYGNFTVSFHKSSGYAFISPYLGKFSDISRQQYAVSITNTGESAMKALEVLLSKSSDWGSNPPHIIDGFIALAPNETFSYLFRPLDYASSYDYATTNSVYLVVRDQSALDNNKDVKLRINITRNAVSIDGRVESAVAPVRDAIAPILPYTRIIDEQDMGPVTVTGDGTVRRGIDLGALEKGAYTIEYEKTTTNDAALYLTRVEQGVYAHEQIDKSGYMFEANGTESIIIRSANINVTNPIGYENVKLSRVCDSLSDVLDTVDGLVETVNEAKADIDRLKEQSGMDYDVCIAGAGAGGIGCAYALKDSGLRVCLIDKNNGLGGTHTQAWVNVHGCTVAPPFLQPVMQPLFNSGKARYVDAWYQDIPQDGVTWEDTLIRKEFRADGKGEFCIFFEPKAMAEKYMDDLKPYITIMTNVSVTSAVTENGVMTSVTLSDGSVIRAKTFVDCTGNDDLVRLANGAVTYGEDAKDAYYAEYGITEANAPTSSSGAVINQCELIYRIKDGAEVITLPGKTNEQSVQAYPNVNGKTYINACNGFGGKNGWHVIVEGYDATMAGMIAALPDNWAKIKANGVDPQGHFIGYTDTSLQAKKLYGHAPMLGIRETYRAKCERMLSENDLYVKINSANLLSSNVLDTYIACGNHIADMHWGGGVNWDAINARRQPYGVKFGSLVPKGIKNLLIASRGAGFTHIGASTFRLNKDIMQLGWCAGKACELFMEDQLADFRYVNAEKLLDDDYTAFTATVKEVETLII